MTDPADKSEPTWEQVAQEFDVDGVAPGSTYFAYSNEGVQRMAKEIVRLREESKIWEKQSIVQLVKENERLRDLVDSNQLVNYCKENLASIKQLHDERAYSARLREALDRVVKNATPVIEPKGITTIPDQDWKFAYEALALKPGGEE